MNTDLLDRLSTKFTVGDGCWEWTAAKIPEGYGAFSVNGRQVGAHRVVYELMVGPIPERMQLDHLCRNRGCVRPDHLEPVTNRENMLRGMSREVTLARHASRTECNAGHPFNEENTYIRADGLRRCRVCRRKK